MSVNVGQTEYFKIKTSSTAYHIDILRIGYYGGNGARKITTITPSVSLPQSQPACLTQASTGLVDCGNWAVSASWAVPSNAVSGVYVAHLVRDDAKPISGESSHIVFVVRNDASHSDVLLQTSDATWEAYNDYGGNSLYTCTVACPPGRPAPHGESRAGEPRSDVRVAPAVLGEPVGEHDNAARLNIRHPRLAVKAHPTDAGELADLRCLAPSSPGGTAVQSPENLMYRWRCCMTSRTTSSTRPSWPRTAGSSVTLRRVSRSSSRWGASK